MINAREETVVTKPAFRSAFKRRRRLVPVDGCYEWLREGKTKTPCYYTLADGRPFTFAGLWESWNDLETFTIITTSANELAAAEHDRMPVMLCELDRWLDPATTVDDLQRLLKPYPAGEMQVQAVSSYVNNARHEGPECLAR